MITVNKTVFLKVFRLIYEAYAQKQGLFAEQRASTVGPQNIFLPSTVVRGSKDHLYWLALVALSDKRTNSTKLYQNFAKMFARNRALFQRGYYPTVKRMTELFRAYKIALPVKEISFFLTRKKHLDQFFDGDPLLIYQGAYDIGILMKNLKEIAKTNGIKKLFPGVKEKILALLAMFLREFVELDFEDVVPVDVWVQSISASTGVLEGTGQIRSETLGDRLRPLVTEVFLPYREVKGAADATWILGKFGCTLCTGRDMSRSCPIYDLCKGPFARSRHLVSGRELGAIRLPLEHRPKYSPKP